MVANLSVQIEHFHGRGFAIRASSDIFVLAFDVFLGVCIELDWMFTDGNGSSLTSDSRPSLSESRRTTSGFSTNWAGGDITGGFDRRSFDELSFA